MSLIDMGSLVSVQEPAKQRQEQQKVEEMLAASLALSSTSFEPLEKPREAEAANAAMQEPANNQQPDNFDGIGMGKPGGVDMKQEVKGVSDSKSG